MSFEAFPLRDENDRAELFRLWRDNFGDHRIKDVIGPRWRWLNDSNPAGPVKICVVTHRETGAVIGSAGALPRTLRIGGASVRAAILCDFVVDKQHRVAGAAVSLQRKLAEACFADGIKLLYGFPNRAAFPVFARVGYKTVGTATMMVRPLRSGHHLRDYVPAVLADTAGFFVDRCCTRTTFSSTCAGRGTCPTTSGARPTSRSRRCGTRSRGRRQSSASARPTT